MNFLLSFRHSLPASLLCGAIFFWTSGCGESNADFRGAVKGKVMLDGKPLEQGRITFEPTGGTQGPVSGDNIKNGVYEMSADAGPAIGKNLVRINANRPSGKKVQSSFGEGEVDELVEAIPARYNAKTTLEREIAAGENNVLDFELTTE